MLHSMAAAPAKPIKSVSPLPAEPVLKCIWFPGKSSVATSLGMLSSKVDVTPSSGITATIEGASVRIVRNIKGVRQHLIVALESVLLEYHEVL